MTPEEAADQVWLDAVAAVKARLDNDDQAFAVIWENTEDRKAAFDGVASIAAMLVEFNGTLTGWPQDQVLGQIRKMALGEGEA